MTDIEINRSVKARPIQDVADQLGIQASELLPYGKLKAKVSLDVLQRLHAEPLGRYVLVTAINPTPLGEGKTTTSIGLAMGLSVSAIERLSRFGSLRWGRCLESKVEEQGEGERKSFRWKRSTSI